MHEILLIDLDGVLRLWPTEVDEQIETVTGLPAGTISRTAFSKELLVPAITGQYSDEDWRSAIATKLSEITDPETAADAVRRWSQSSGKRNESCLQLLEEVAPRVEVALVTNATSRLMSDLNVLGIQERFSGVFNSAELGVAKPDREFFELVLKRLKAKPESCLYIDDSPSHVSAARQIGIESHLFDGTAGARRFLEAAGIL